jgi:hypothetical protein
VLVSAEDPLACKESVTMDELRTVQLWFPAIATPSEWVGYLDELRADFDLEIDYTGSTMGFEYFVSRITTGVHRATFLGTAMAIPDGLRTLAITGPAPVFPWWAIWRRHVPSQLVHRLLTGMTGTGPPAVSLPDPARIWLPKQDRACLAEDSMTASRSEV